MRSLTTTVLGLVAMSLLTACGSTASGAGAGSAPRARTGTATTPTARSTPPHPTTTLTPSDVAEVKAPQFPSGTGRQFARNKGAWDLVLRDVRVGNHEGFQRLVVEFKGTGTPGWGAQYAKTPRAEGSGKVVDVHGDNFLDVTISGVTIRKGYPTTPEDFFHGARHFAPNGGAIEDINVGGVFEGYSQLFLGIGGEKVQFRVFALTNPSRLVVDVKDP